MSIRPDPTTGSKDFVEKSPPRYNDQPDPEKSALRQRSDAAKRDKVPDVAAGELILDVERDGVTQRGLKSRHAQMIALGGTIGTGLFVGSGQTLARGGPAFILGCYTVMAFGVWCVVSGIVELAAWVPTPGCSMNLFGHRYVSRTMGFSMGWLYFYSLGILVPYEITAAGLVIEYWQVNISIAVWISIMIVVIVGLNVLPVKFYGETEFWFAGLKVIMMLGLLLMSVVLFFGGGPNKDRLGFRYWENPGAANTYLETGDKGRFVALLSTFVLSAFPFVFAPELLIATGGEMESPRRNLPTAAKRYIWRLVIFYIFSVFAIGVICPSNEPRLTSGGAGAGSSPFVVAIKDAGIPVLDHIINAGIIISAWSSGNSFLFLSSRSLYALALGGNAPAFFRVCTKGGVPLRAVICSALFCALAYLNVGSSSAVVFNWFVNLTNTSGFISWICCGVVYLRFRAAVKAQNIPLEELPYRSWMQPWGSWCAIVGFSFLLIINGFTVFWPEKWSVSNFMTAYVGIPLFLCFFVGHKIYAWSDPWAIPSEQVDMVTGLDELIADERPRKVFRNWQKVRINDSQKSTKMSDSHSHEHTHDDGHSHSHDHTAPPNDDWKTTGVRVIPADSLDSNTAQTPGMDRAAAINFARVGAQKIWAGTVNIHPDAKTGAHHHGHLESVIYILKGKARMRWGEKLEFTAEAGPGDFIYVPPYVPHQEINASADEKLECVLMRSDSEAIAVNLPDLEPIEKPTTVKWIDPTHTT
ncbi:unnamed protein product [Zymoseptoria tritici ST99CH_1A5]|nr:unnamed protein product [Zymoseptoria tritici ST99CH_3D1]SMY22970.1 unnamed protein product [Zymoseptoria tritici ST99CH_1A5]